MLIREGQLDVVVGVLQGARRATGNAPTTTRQFGRRASHARENVVTPI